MRKRLDYRSSNRVAREGRSLVEWVHLYQRNPRAVPPAVLRTLEQRRYITREVSNVR